MTTTPQMSRESHRDDDVIPANDVPAFGVQMRFAKRVLRELFAQLRHRDRSTRSASRS
jgi:hypothetical protein